MKQFLSRFLNKSLSRQITAIYLFLTLLIIVVMVITSSLFIPKIFTENYLSTTNSSYSATTAMLSGMLSNIDVSVSSAISADERLFSLLSADYEKIKDGYQNYNAAIKIFDRAIDIVSPEIPYKFQAILFIDDALPLSRMCSDLSALPNRAGKALFSNSTGLNEQPWYQRASEESDAFYWFIDEKKGVLCGAKRLTSSSVENFEVTITNIGTLCIMLDPAYFARQIRSSSYVTRNSVVTLKLSDTDMDLGSFNEKARYYVYESILPTGITVRISTPQRDIHRMSFVYIAYLPLATGMMLLNVIIVVRFISKNLTKPILSLSTHINSAESLSPVSVSGLPENEIRDIYTSYNELLVRIKNLITEKEIEAEKRKEHEYAMHQLQINPHFIYNTLNTLSCYMMLRNEDDIVKVLNDLSDYLHYNYNNPQAEVTIAEDLKQLENYIQIQNVKYCGKIMLKVEIPEAHLRLKITKMLMQPLAENAIDSELGLYDDSPMTIRIYSYIVHDKLQLCVANDAVCEDVDRINDHIAGKINISRHSGGLGTRNINERLALKYGSDYGLQYEVSDIETIARLTLPILPGQDTDSSNGTADSRLFYHDN